MAEASGRSREERSAIRHLEAALEADETAEIDFRVRQAMQLLGVE